MFTWAADVNFYFEHAALGAGRGGAAMNSFSRSILARSLMTGAASLAFMMASAVAVRAQTIGTDGEPGADCFTDLCEAGNGTDGESVSSGGNPAMAIGGAGGSAGVAFPSTATDGFAGNGGDATATSSALSNGSANAASAATATGGDGGRAGNGGYSGGAGGSAIATSASTANGSGNATSVATATVGFTTGVISAGPGGNAVATSSATANGSGGATVSATATAGISYPDPGTTINATSNAETAKGGLAQAQAQTDLYINGEESQSTAKTTFGGVVAKSTVDLFSGGSTDATAQGGSGQSPDNPGLSGFAFSTALPNAAYATSLIGSASNVADALLGPDATIFGTAILGGYGDDSSTLDFSFRGDLILGVITDGGFDIVVNGKDILFEDRGDNSVINLGSTLGPDINLTIEAKAPLLSAAQFRSPRLGP
jgi:hypothetical protein